MRLSHLHLPYQVSYSRSLQIQEHLLTRQFAYNTARRQKSPSSTPQTSIPPPPPTLLTFQTTPTYTVGRRHLKTNPLSPSQIDFLTSHHLATFYASPRGGLLTYHAPGQLTAYLIYNLRHHDITPRCHIRLLEDSVINTAAKYGVKGRITDDPGVWVVDTNEKTGEEKTSDRKLCAIGVHVTRGITSHGIGFNVWDHSIPTATPPQTSEPPRELYKLPESEPSTSSTQESSRLAPGYLSWGFSRIVACGLEGKSVTWLTREGAPPDTTVENVAVTLAEEVCAQMSSKGRIKVEGVDRVVEADVMDEDDRQALRNDVEKIVGDERAPRDLKAGLEDWVGVLKGGKL